METNLQHKLIKIMNEKHVFPVIMKYEDGEKPVISTLSQHQQANIIKKMEYLFDINSVAKYQLIENRGYMIVLSILDNNQNMELFNHMKITIIDNKIAITTDGKTYLAFD